MRKIAKRAVAMLSVFLMLFSTLITVQSSSDIRLTVGSTVVEKGTGTETVYVPITISNNMGIIGMTLTINYDKELTLIGVNKGDTLTSLTMTKPGEPFGNPVKVTWDGESENDYGNGTAVTLSFTVPKDMEKEYPIEISVSGVVDENINPVAISIENGKIIVDSKSSSDDTILDSGTDANGIKWYFYETGLLKISGTGSMQNYSGTSSIPWYSEKANILEVEIFDGITHIGNRSFYNCISLGKVTIPNSVTSIGTYAFRNCSEVTIYAESGTYAETYATENSIPFVNTKEEELKTIVVDPYGNASTWCFDISIEGYTDEATAYAAIYDEYGKMLAITSEDFVIDDVTTLIIPKSGITGASYAKIYVWEGAIEPIAYDEKIDL